MKKTTVSVLTLKGKHDDTPYVYTNQEGLSLICADILRERVEQGYWYETLPANVEDAREPSRFLNSEELSFFALTDDEIEGMPESLREFSLIKRDSAQRKYRSAVRDIDDLVRFWNDVNKVLAATEEELLTLGHVRQDGKFLPLSHQVLASRDDYEYEGFDISSRVTAYLPE